MNVVTLGGGTGTFVVLSALKKVPGLTLTAIVSGADDGGSTGHLRDAYGFLPAGDVRQALVALSEEKSTLRELFAYRFDKGNIAGHSLGNLFLTALTDILGSDAKAVEEAGKVLRIRGRVLSSTEHPATLVATLENGTTIEGEHLIDAQDTYREKIISVSYKEPMMLSKHAQEAIEKADVLVLGPGDLYTSTVASLLAQGTKDAIQHSSARLVYIVNLFTKSGQTTGLSASEHAHILANYTGKYPDHLLMNTQEFSEDILTRYGQEQEYPVKDDLGSSSAILRGDFVSIKTVPALPGDEVARSLVRHDSGKLSTALTTLFS